MILSLIPAAVTGSIACYAHYVRVVAFRVPWALLAASAVPQWVNRHYALPPIPRFFAQALNANPGVYWGIVLSLMYALWPFAVGLILLVFQQSMRRAKIKTSHVMRCTFYSADAGPVMALACAPLASSVLFEAFLDRKPVPPLEFAVSCCWLLLPCLCLAVYRLTVAYKGYLRFPSSGAVVLASQFVYLLAWTCLILATMPPNVAWSLMR